MNSLLEIRLKAVVWLILATTGLALLSLVVGGSGRELALKSAAAAVAPVMGCVFLRRIGGRREQRDQAGWVPGQHPDHEAFTVPSRVRFVYFVVFRLRGVGILLLSVWLPLLLVFVVAFAVFSSVLVVAQRAGATVRPTGGYQPSVQGLLGALAGAILTAIVSGLISLYVQFSLSQAQALISKKEDIYHPLYDDLLSLKHRVRRDPYPFGVQLDPDSDTDRFCARFTRWTEMKTDGRSVEVPSWIADILEQYTQDLRRYSSTFKRSAARVEAKLRGELTQRTTGDLPAPTGLGDFALKCTLDEDSSALHNALTLGRDSLMTRDQGDRLVGQLSVWKPVEQVRLVHQRVLVEELDWLLDEIGKIIRYINLRYEVQGWLF